MAKKVLPKNPFKKRDIKKFGHYVFAFGAVLVVLFALTNPTVLSMNKAVFLLVLGLIVGLMDVPKKEANSFILATIAIIVVSIAKFDIITYTLSGTPFSVGQYIKGILMNASIFLSLAMLVVASKIIYRVYKGTK